MARFSGIWQSKIQQDNNRSKLNLIFLTTAMKSLMKLTSELESVFQYAYSKQCDWFLMAAILAQKCAIFLGKIKKENLEKVLPIMPSVMEKCSIYIPILPAVTSQVKTFNDPVFLVHKGTSVWYWWPSYLVLCQWTQSKIWCAIAWTQ